MSEIIEHGGEIHIEGFNDIRKYDRIEITEGVVKCINKAGYQVDYWPIHEVNAIHTHTSDEQENADWW